METTELKYGDSVLKLIKSERFLAAKLRPGSKGSKIGDLVPEFARYEVDGSLAKGFRLLDFGSPVENIVLIGLSLSEMHQKY